LAEGSAGIAATAADLMSALAKEIHRKTLGAVKLTNSDFTTTEMR